MVALTSVQALRVGALVCWSLPVAVVAEFRLLAVPDVHGDLEALRGALQLAGVQLGASPALPSNTTLVSLGDLVDRGPSGPACYTELAGLAEEANRANSTSQVIRLLGNHEWFNLLGVDKVDHPETPHVQEDLLAPYVHSEEIATLGGWRRRLAVFGPKGAIGRMIQRDFRLLALLPAPWREPSGKTRPAKPSKLPPLSSAATLFLHGGISSSTARRYPTAAALDAEARQQLLEWGARGDPAVLLSGRPPPDGTDLFDELLQDRRLAQGPEGRVCPELRVVLAHFGAARLVLGHTPQLGGNRWGQPGRMRRAGVHCRGRLVLLDVAMSRWLVDMRRPESAPRPALLELRYQEADQSEGNAVLTGLRVLYGRRGGEGEEEEDLLPPLDGTSSESAAGEHADL